MDRGTCEFVREYFLGMRERVCGGVGVWIGPGWTRLVVAWGSYLRYYYLLSSSAGFIPLATTMAYPGGIVGDHLVAARVYTPRYYYQLSSSAVFIPLATTN